MCTGTNRRYLSTVLAAAAILLTSGGSRAQSLKLISLSLPGDVPSGSWVSYQVNVESKNRPPHRFTQRLAVVSREGSGEESGAWVELSTFDRGRIRFERGFFVRQHGRGNGHDSTSGSAPGLTLARYQALTPDGTLYEYPVGEEGAPIADADVSAMDLIEFAGASTSDSLPPDTLRIGGRIIPCQVSRIRKYGTQDWKGDDTTYVNRAVMTRTNWNNSGIPMTGYARSTIEVSTERVPIRSPSSGDSAGLGAQPDSAGLGDAAQAAQETRQAGQGSFYRADVTLVDSGHDAIPEVTQPPEPTPAADAPRPRRVIR
ncbi:MAG TPA: hypothetical protein VGJ98_01530 [Candidatus Eisenbacteria bacterium]